MAHQCPTAHALLPSSRFESNDIIGLYPQTISSTSLGNPTGCWDWYGYVDDNYECAATRPQRCHVTPDAVTRGCCSIGASWRLPSRGPHDWRLLCLLCLLCLLRLLRLLQLLRLW